MTLKPIRFTTEVDLNLFFDRLQELKLITINNASLSITPELNKSFIKAIDGSVFLLTDIQNYLNVSSEEELQSNEFLFLKKVTHLFNDLTPSEQNKPYIPEYFSLEQLKANPDMLQELDTGSFGEFIESLNPNLYSFDSLPILHSITEVIELYGSLNNLKLSQTIANKKVTIANKKVTLESLKLILDPTSKSGFFPSIELHELDIYKISLQQQNKLKSHLLNQTTLQENKELKEWIVTIEKENAAIQEMLTSSLEFHKSLLQHNEEYRKPYKKFLEEDPNLEKTKAKLEAKKKEVDTVEKSLLRKQTAFKILKPLVAYGTIILLIFLTLVAILAFFTLTITLVPIGPLAHALLIMEMVCTFGLTSLLVPQLVKLMNIIYEGFDNNLSNTEKELRELQIQQISDSPPSKSDLEVLKPHSGMKKFEEFEHILHEIKEMLDKDSKGATEPDLSSQQEHVEADSEELNTVHANEYTNDNSVPPEEYNANASKENAVLKVSGIHNMFHLKKDASISDSKIECEKTDTSDVEPEEETAGIALG